MNPLHKELHNLISSDINLFDMIHTAAVDGMWYWDLVNKDNGWVSDSLWHTLGYEPEKARKEGVEFGALLFPEDLEKYKENLQELYEGKTELLETLLRYKRKSGHTVYLQTRILFLKDDKGQPFRLLGIANDYTEQKEQEKQKQLERDRFLAIIEGSEMGTWEWNVQTGETRFNERWAEIIGHKLSELEPTTIETWGAFAHPEDLEKSGKLLQDHFEGKTNYYRAEARMKHKNGQWVWVLDKGRVLTWTEDGKPEWMVGSHQDITMKKNMERSLAKAYRNTKTIIEHAPVAIAMFDNEMNYLAASPRWLEESGLAGRNVIGLNHYEVSHILKEDWKEIHQKGLQGERQSQEEDLVELPNGEELWLKWDVIPWMDGTEIGGVIIYTQNITPLKQSELKLEHANQLLNKTNEIADIGTWWVDLVNMTTNWSPATKRIHEVPMDYQGKVEEGINFYKEGWSRDKITRLFQNSVATGEPFDDEFLIVTASGRERWVRSIGIPTMENGRCVHIHGIFQNIDGLKRDQENVLALANKYKGILEAIPDTIAKIRKGKVTAVYGSAVALVHTELISHDFQKDIEEVFTKNIASGIREALDSDNSISNIEVYEPALSRHYEIRSVDYDYDKSTVLIRDITEKIETHEELEYTKNLLQRSSEVARVGGWDIDIKNQKLIWSDMIREILEVDDSYVPEFETSNNFYKPDDLLKLQEVIQKSIDNCDKFEIELQNITAKGNHVWTKLIGYPVYEDGECEKIYGIMQDIDAQKQIQMETELREEQFRSAFYNTAIGMALISTKGTIIENNKRFAEILGRESEDLTGMDYSRFTFKEDLQKETPKLHKLMNGESESYSLEKRVLRPDKEPVWTLDAVTRVKNREGETEHFIAQILDINDEKEVRAELERSEFRFRSIFNSTFQFIGFINKEGNILELNHTIQDFSGYELDELAGTKLWDAGWWRLGKEEKQKLVDSVKAAAQGDFIRYETEVFDQSGNKLTIDFNITPMIGHSGKTEMLIVEGRRIDEMVEYREKLFETAAHLRSILDASSRVAIIEADHSGIISTYNKGAEILLGYTEEEAIGKMSVKDFHTETVWEQWAKELKAKNGGADYKDLFQIMEKQPELTFEIEYLRKDGSTFPGLVTRSPVYNRKGERSGVLVIITDITDLKSSEREIRQLLEITTEQNKRLLNFAHIVSHNLRSHAGNMEMLLDLLAADNPEFKDNDYYPYLVKAAHGLMETINHLNKVAAMNIGDSNDLEPLHLRKYIDKAKEIVRADSIRAVAEFNIDIPEKLVIMGVPAYLDSIFLNLFTNSLKYSSKKRKPKIDVSYEEDDKTVTVIVEDNGIGIDLDKYGSKIFGLYNTFHSKNQNPESKGIGLFITKNQIEAMGGRIEVESIPDIGTKFRLCLRK